MTSTAQTQVTRRRIRRLACLCAALAYASCAAALPPGPNPPGGTATRAVVEYAGFEAQLLEGGHRGDPAALEALLAEDFAGFAPANGEPADRAQFIAAAIRRRETGRIHGLAVLERDGLQVVSFLLQLDRAAPRGSRAESVYIVDLWRQQRLLARYRSTPRHSPPPPSAPSGRD